MTDFTATIERDALADAAAWAGRSLPLRPSVPVLSGVLIESNDTGDALILSTFDYETSTRAVVPGDVQEPGKVLVSGRLLADICKSLPSKPVTLHIDGPKLVVTCQRSKFTLQTMPVEEYPALPAMPETTGTVESAAFFQAVSQAAIAASRDDTLGQLAGVRMEFTSGFLSLLATDRFRLTLRDVAWNAKGDDAEALVPAKILAETAKNLSAGDHVTIALSASDNGGVIGFEGQGPGGVRRRTTTRLMDGEFPRARALFPTSTTTTAHVDRHELVDAIKRVSLVAERNTAVQVRLDPDEGTMTLDAGDGDNAVATEVLDAVVDGPGITTGYNPTFLLDGLNALDSAAVRFSFTTAAKPAVIVAVDDEGDTDEDYKYLLMPRRLLS